MIQVDITRNLIGLEDLLTGVGTVEQIRGNGDTTTTITAINAANLPYDANSTLQEKLDELQTLAESLSVVDVNGNFLTGLINTSDLALDLDGRLWRKTVDAVVAEIYYGTVLLFKYDRTNGGLILPDNVNYIAADTALSAALTTAYTDADTLISNDLAALDASLGTAALLNVGVGALNIVQLDAASKLPAVDGSALTNLPDTMPIGAIIMVPYSVPDTKYLECNGTAVSRVTYSALYTKLGTTYGVGDGSTTFNLPDLRGEFVRGWDNGRTVDTGRVLGSLQLDAFKAHNHNVPLYADGGGNNTSNPYADGTGAAYAGRATTTTGSTETRPRNIALMFQIKAL